MEKSNALFATEGISYVHKYERRLEGKEQAHEGRQVAMVTIKGADQTRRDEVPFCRQLCYTEATANRKIGSTLPTTFLLLLLRYSFARYPSGNYFWNWNDIERFIPLMSLKKWNRVPIFFVSATIAIFSISICLCVVFYVIWGLWITRELNK